jgi:hypothetical protein
MKEVVFPRIRCAVCDKQVDQIVIETDYFQPGRRIKAICHGAEDVMVITPFDAINLGPEGMQQIIKTEGVAFKGQADALLSPPPEPTS